MMANPRKFSEKIALHNQKQAEETAAFEQIMREVMGATRGGGGGAGNQVKTYNHLHINQNAGNLRAGSLPNVNQVGTMKDCDGRSSIDLQSALNNLADIKSGREPLRERSRQLSPSGLITNRIYHHQHLHSHHSHHQHGPHQIGYNHRPMMTGNFDQKQRNDTSPYSAVYLSPPPADTNWRRTNSDSALHQSAMMLQQEESYLNESSLRRSADNSNLESMSWDPGKKLTQHLFNQHLLTTTSLPNESRPKSCEVPGITIYPSQEDPTMGHHHHIPISSNTGSLPDLTNLHFPAPLSTPIDIDDQHTTSNNHHHHHSHHSPQHSHSNNINQQSTQADNTYDSPSYISQSMMTNVYSPTSSANRTTLSPPTHGMMINKNSNNSTLNNNNNLVNSGSSMNNNLNSVNSNGLSEIDAGNSNSICNDNNNNANTPIINGIAGHIGVHQNCLMPNDKNASLTNSRHQDDVTEMVIENSKHQMDLLQQQTTAASKQQQQDQQQVCYFIANNHRRPNITVEGITVDTSALSLNNTSYDNAKQVSTQQQQVLGFTHHYTNVPDNQTNITRETQVDQFASLGRHRSTTPSDHSCSAPTSPVSSSMSPIASPGLTQNIPISKSPFIDNSYYNVQLQQTNVLQHQFEQFKMAPCSDLQDPDNFLMMPDLSAGQSSSSSASSSTGALYMGASNGNTRTMNESVNKDYSLQQSPHSALIINSSSCTIEAQQSPLSSLYYSTSEISGNLLIDTTAAASPIYSTDVTSSPSSSSYEAVTLASQVTNQSPTQNKIPDIILTGPNIHEDPLLRNQEYVKDIGCAMVSMSNSFDTNDLFSADEAFRAGLDPIDFDNLQILTDIADTSNDDAFRSLDRS